MNVLFISYCDFRSPSGMHIFHLANALEKQGVRSAVFSVGKAETVTRYGKAKFYSYDAKTSPSRIIRERGFKEGETIFHCWTPREPSRLFTSQFGKNFRAPVIVHMEDNEEAIIQAHIKNLNPPPEDYASLWEPNQALARWSHPERYREFLASSAGYTCIVDELLDFKPKNVPGLVFWPSCEKEVFEIPQESSIEEKAKWGIKPEEYVVFYPGNMHLNNYEEVLHLYLAVAFLRKTGIPVRIIKFGASPFNIQETAFAPFGLKDVVVDITQRITPSQIPNVMRAADFLVQPGEDNAFNRYRFPCKLPLFFASARPVILPPLNLGKHLTHGENCLLLQKKKSDPEEIASYLRLLIQKPELAQKIGAKGREFAKERFSWDASAAKVKAFYKSVLASAAPGSNRASL